VFFTNNQLEFHGRNAIKEMLYNSNTDGPRYSRTFYMRIRLFILAKMVKVSIFWSKMYFLSANSRFAVQNVGTYLPRITRETCIELKFRLLYLNVALLQH
jgi:hypothetical protein